MNQVPQTAPKQISPELWLATELTKLEGGKEQVNIAQMTEVVSKLQMLLLGQHGNQVISILMKKVWAVVETRAKLKLVLEAVDNPDL